MKKELRTKAEDILSKQDIADAGMGKVVMALGIGALFSEKLRKVAKYLVIGGVLIQVPVALRVTKKVVEFAKQVKREQAAKNDEEPSSDQAAPEAEQEGVAEKAEAVAETDSEPTSPADHATPDFSALDHPFEPSSHPHEDPTS